MIINCNCSVKTNISIVEPMAKLDQLGDIEKSLAIGSTMLIFVLTEQLQLIIINFISTLL